MRACGRYGSEYAAQAEAGLAGVALIPIDQRVLALAARLGPAELRTLDAVHLATALSLHPDIGVLIAYDDRLSAAAHRHGLAVAAPR